VGILQRQLALKRGHLPVRRLVQKLPNLLPRLKPCFLMSPLSVAQHLDTSFPPFDLVVFDEASQIPVWDAVGAISRGSEVIGDRGGGLQAIAADQFLHASGRRGGGG
jgi:superfamily I DNA and/or RNA helicase